MSYLTTFGIDPTLLGAISYGSEKPVDPGHNEKARQKSGEAISFP